jgi:TRAP-type C4-dicarboxylate transport system permease small subunit
MAQLDVQTTPPASAFDRILGMISIIPLAVIVCLTFADVFARYVFSAPIKGSIEIIEYAMALVIFSALPLVTRQRGHVSVTLFESLFKGKTKRLKNVLCDALSAIALLMLAWRISVQATDDLQASTTTMVLGLPHAPLYFALAVLAAVSAIVTLQLLWNNLRCEEEPA